MTIRDPERPKQSLSNRLQIADLFVPGYCDNPEADEPILNILIFEDDGGPIAYAFTSLAAMRRFFKTSGLPSLKYMQIRAPSHIEAMVANQRDLVVNPGPKGQRFSVEEIRAILQKIESFPA